MRASGGAAGGRRNEAVHCVCDGSEIFLFLPYGRTPDLSSAWCRFLGKKMRDSNPTRTRMRDVRGMFEVFELVMTFFWLPVARRLGTAGIY